MTPILLLLLQDHLHSYDIAIFFTSLTNPAHIKHSVILSIFLLTHMTSSWIKVTCLKYISCLLLF